MVPPVLLVAGLLFAPACCGPPPPPAASASAETSRAQQTAGASRRQPLGGQPSVSLDQVVAKLSDFYRDAARAAAAEPLAELSKTLAGIQASVAAVSGRLDLIHDTQVQQQKAQTDLAKRLGMLEKSQAKSSSHLQEIEQAQNRVSDRIESMVQWQTEASSRLDTIQGTLSELGGLHRRQNESATRLDAVQGAQSELLRALSARFDAVDASQGDLSSRVDTLLERAAPAAATGPAGIQGQLDAIEAAVRLIPRIVLGKPCSSDADCSSMLPEAECGGGGLCSCRDGYRQVSNTECRRPSQLSEICLEHADCQTLASNATCTRGVCSCVDGFWNHNNAECRRISVVGMNGTCVGDQDCDSGRHIRCVSGACSCPVKTLGDYDYRLVGGSACNEGNVQLRRTGGTWGRVCDDDWGSNDAKVVCRSLGFSSGSPTIKSAYGRGTNFYMDNVGCRGSESHLLSCGYRGWGRHNCGAGEVAGVKCS